jgi:hypothetical protein
MVSARGAACRTYQNLRFLDADEGLPVLENSKTLILWKMLVWELTSYYHFEN